MSKVIFAVVQQDPEVTANGWKPDLFAFLWKDEILDEAEHEISSVPEDTPLDAGIWIWEGTIEVTRRGKWDRLRELKWTGTWRRPTPYELTEIAEGRWPKEWTDYLGLGETPFVPCKCGGRPEPGWGSDGEALFFCSRCTLVFGRARDHVDAYEKWAKRQSAP